MNIQGLPSKAIFILIVLLLTSLYSCYSKGNITKEIQEKAPSLSETNIKALSNISLDDLRKSKDSDNGALYYAGLLWFLNGKSHFAEIAWKRSARTSTTPWKEESQRLVGYLLTRESKFNQIAPFFDDIVSKEDILKDPELFTYYARGLWTEKKFESLDALLKQTPTFAPTLRRRVSTEQAYFNFDMWKALISTRNAPQDAELALKELLTKYSLHNQNAELPIYLSNISNFSIEQNLSTNIQSLIALRSEQLNIRQIYDIFITLDHEYFQYPWIVFDLLSNVTRLNRKYQNVALTIFQSAIQSTPQNTQRKERSRTIKGNITISTGGNFVQSWRIQKMHSIVQARIRHARI